MRRRGMVKEPAPVNVSMDTYRTLVVRLKDGVAEELGLARKVGELAGYGVVYLDHQPQGPVSVLKAEWDVPDHYYAGTLKVKPGNISGMLGVYWVGGGMMNAHAQYEQEVDTGKVGLTEVTCIWRDAMGGRISARYTLQEFSASYQVREGARLEPMDYLWAQSPPGTGVHTFGFGMMRAVWQQHETGVYFRAGRAGGEEYSSHVVSDLTHLWSMLTGKVLLDAVWLTQQVVNHVLPGAPTAYGE